MWIVGVIAGLVVGALLESVGAALFLACIGGLVTRGMGRDTHRESGARGRTVADDASEELRALRLKVQTLEQRLEQIETQLAQGAQGVVAEPDALPDAPPEPEVAVPLPIAALAPEAAESQGREEASARVFDLDEDRNPVREPVHAPYAPVQPREDSGIPPRWREPVPSEPEPPAVPWRDRLPAPVSALLFGGNTLVKLGVLILFLGLAFLLRYTVEHVTVPVELRYAGVALAGAGLLALGWFLRDRRRDYALVLQGAGIGVFYLTTLAAMKFHTLLEPGMGFGFLSAVALLGAALAVLQNASVLAIIAALAGFATPVLTSTGGNQMVALFTYLAILDAAIVLVARYKAWRSLNLIGFVGTFTLAAGWADRHYTHAQYAPVQAFLILFFLLFTAAGVLFARRTLVDSESALSRDDSLAARAGAAIRHVGRVDSALVFGTPITAFGLQYLLTELWEFGPAFSALAFAAFYLLLARWVFSREQQGLSLLAEAYAIVAVIFGTLAIPLGFEGAWTGAAWAVEGAGMYWLGVRQQRAYSRAFAYLVLVGATFKLLAAMSLSAAADAPLLEGSTLGPILLAASAFTMWRLHRRAGFDNDSGWETLPGSLLPWLGVAAVTVLPWQWFVPPVAAAATAVLATAISAAARRSGLPSLEGIASALQALAVASFLGTVHRASQTAGVALAGGWESGLAAMVIAVSLLLTALRRLAHARREGGGDTAGALALATGVAGLHLASLFALDLEMAALLWPVSASLALWGALRLGLSLLALVAAALQFVSAGLFLHTDGLIDTGFGQGAAVPAGFAHQHFWTPVVFALAAWFCGDRIRAGAARLEESMRNFWCAHAWAQWAPVLWGLGWWLVAWFSETDRVLEIERLSVYLPAASVALALVTAALLAALAAWRDWAPMGAATATMLPSLVFAALLGAVGSRSVWLPSAHLGVVAWPLALAAHLGLLQRQRRWLPRKALNALHVAGFWLFLLLAARECLLRFEGLGTPDSSWAMLGWALAPALAFWLVSASPLRERWPLAEYRRAYIEAACAPVALYLFAWSVAVNVASAGDASPLPYLLLLNPLELGQWLVLAALLLWWRALPECSPLRLPDSAFKALVAAAAWFIVTGMVLRGCHHFADVPWRFAAQFESRLAQAALSIAWAVMGVLVMVLGNRRVSRPTWLAGAALLGVVVVKLFLFELAGRGGLYRIVSFIGVGVLLLIVGYFAPVPVKRDAESARESA